MKLYKINQNGVIIDLNGEIINETNHIDISVIYINIFNYVI